MTPDPLPFGPDHVAISVADLDASVDWYGRVFGLVVEHRFTNPALGVRGVYLAANGFRLEILYIDRSAPYPASRSDPGDDLRVQGVKHFALKVADLAGTLAVVKSRGAEVVWENHVNEQLRHVAGVVRDNSGNLIELIQPLPPV